LQEVNVLGTKVHALSRQETLLKLTEFLLDKESHFIVTANAEMYYEAFRDQELREVINQADLNIPDSIGIIMALRLSGFWEGELFPGVEICSWLLQKKLPTYILGAKQEVLDKIVLSQVIGKQNGYFSDKDEQQIIMDIQQKKPKILLVALGAGKQERWIAKYRKILNIPIMIGIGGSIDIISGTKKRAPAIMRNLRLEWLYRLYKEPARIYRQINLLYYLIAVVFNKKRN
jgi:N-acetylglucosaminyldiphosphoundecaprenol N-acetyl-beta-D-mannosaminyltransferase